MASFNSKNNKYFFLMALFLVQGCSAPNLSTSAAIQVDVDVYKGPLSENPELQFRELIGLLKETKQALNNFSSGFVPKNNNTQSFRHQAIDINCDAMPDHNSPRHEDTSICQSLRQIRAELSELLEETVPLVDKFSTIEKEINDYEQQEALKIDSADQRKKLIFSVRDLLRHASHFSMRLKTNSVYWAESLIPNSPGWELSFASLFKNLSDARAARTVIVAFAHISSEYANQLTSRSDMLLKQLDDGNAIEARYLPTSIFLRDTNPTDFTNLYCWKIATTPATFEENLRHPFESAEEECADRVRAVERLFADHYWSKINTVYASGQGDVSMALIRDAIGNWSLKSFSSDPSELLQGYRDLTKVTTDTAITLMQKAASGGADMGAAIDMLKVASQMTAGQSPQSVSKNLVVQNVFDMAKLKQDTLYRLDAVKQKYNKKVNDKSDVASSLDINAIMEITTILDNYSKVLSTLQKSVVDR